MKVLAISGSLRRDSLNTRLLRAAAELAPSGVEVELLDPSVLKELPLYDPDDDGVTPPVAARRLRGSIRLADAILHTLKHGGPLEIRYRINSHGRVRHVLARGICTLDTSGRAQRFPGVMLEFPDQVS